MDKIWLCQKHALPLELYCNCCRTQICPECLSTHDTTCPDADYMHVFERAAETSLPKLDALIKESASIGPEHDVESTELLTSLYNIITPLQRLVAEHTEDMQKLKTASKQIVQFAKAMQAKKPGENAWTELEKCKKRLEQALKIHNIPEVIRTTQKIVAESEKKGGNEEEKKLLAEVKEKLSKNEITDALRKLAEEVQLVLFKCQRLRLNFSVFNWKCDREYLCPKLALSEDDLEISCVQGTNYAAIIGDTPIDYGMMIFEVTATGLCCSGKEGFGVIEYDTYRELFKTNPKMPTAYSQMVGLMHGDIAKGMVILAGNELLLGVAYTVIINMCDHVLHIRGPGTLLMAELKSGVQYVPCFSLGCSKNKIKIQPLEALFDEDY